MIKSDLSVEELAFIDKFHADATAGQIVTLALLCSGVGDDGERMVSGYSRSDFKRAIRALREDQVKHPKYAADYEDAITHIRQKWMKGDRL